MPKNFFLQRYGRSVNEQNAHQEFTDRSQKLKQINVFQNYDFKIFGHWAFILA